MRHGAMLEDPLAGPDMPSGIAIGQQTRPGAVSRRGKPEQNGDKQAVGVGG